MRTTLPDGSYWMYEYDSLGHVVSGKKYWSDGAPVAGQQFEYAADNIGNRTTTKRGGDQNGMNLRTASYGSSGVWALNQYASRSLVPVSLIGVAGASSTVSVTAAPDTFTMTGSRKGEYFSQELTFGNTGVPRWETVTVSIGGQTPNSVGSIFVPPSPENFTYDKDGNLATDGHWTYTWDAESRLIKMVSKISGNLTVTQLVKFEYDWMGRRIRKQVWNGTDDTVAAVTEERYVYDGWNLIAIMDASLSAKKTFAWGLDLSGSMQGAGGAGGLLWVNDKGTSKTHFVGYDGNGNVTLLLDSANAAAAGQTRYEYGPFGEPLRASGPMAKGNPFRFSAKFTDDETDLIYYGYRYYNPLTGRWLSRDPIGEKGGFNLYGFVCNQPIQSADAFGLTDWKWDDGGDGTKTKAGGMTSITMWFGYGVVSEDEDGRWQLTSGGMGAVSYQWGDDRQKKHEKLHVSDTTKEWNDYQKKAKSLEGKFCSRAKADCLAGVIEGLMSRVYRLVADREAALLDCTTYPDGADKDANCRACDAIGKLLRSLIPQLNQAIEDCKKL